MLVLKKLISWVYFGKEFLLFSNKNGNVAATLLFYFICIRMMIYIYTHPLWNSMSFYGSLVLLCIFVLPCDMRNVIIFLWYFWCLYKQSEIPWKAQRNLWNCNSCRTIKFLMLDDLFLCFLCFLWFFIHFSLFSSFFSFKFSCSCYKFLELLPKFPWSFS